MKGIIAFFLRMIDIRLEGGLVSCRKKKNNELSVRSQANPAYKKCPIEKYYLTRFSGYRLLTISNLHRTGIFGVDND